MKKKESDRLRKQDSTLEELRNFQKKVQYYRSQFEGITIKIEERDPNFVYLIHSTTLDESSIQDVYQNGLAYTGNEIWRTFHNLSQNWESSRNLFREKADLTSMEQVIVDSCTMSYQCFLYKIPLVFFQPTVEGFYPIPIWYYDKSYQLKYNISSSGVAYDERLKKSKVFRIYPTLLLGHYDLTTNTFQANPNYSYHISNVNGIYDRRQLIYLENFREYADLWTHNEYILREQQSPFKEIIEQISEDFHNYLNDKKIL